MAPVRVRAFDTGLPTTILSASWDSGSGAGSQLVLGTADEDFIRLLERLRVLGLNQRRRICDRSGLNEWDAGFRKFPRKRPRLRSEPAKLVLS